MGAKSAPSPSQNQLIAAMPEDVVGRLAENLELVAFPLGKVVYEAGAQEHYVYFPTDCIVSLLYTMESGASAEISVVGNEGLVGIAVVMGGESTTSRAVVQSAGSAYRLPSQRLKDEFNRHGEFLHLMLRYTQALLTQMAQMAVCNRHHSIDQQLCRWLLLSLDRLSGDELNMTQELIANMLGVRREGVTEAAGKLHKRGVIEYKRGRIRVLDRPELESLSCECYLFFTFDRLGAEAIGLPVNLINLGLMAGITLTIIAGMKTVGVILVISLMVGPAITAYLLVRELHLMMFWGAAIGAIASAIGMYASYYVDLPSGPAIALTVFALFITALLFSPSQGIVTRSRIADRLRQRINRRTDSSR